MSDSSTLVTLGPAGTNGHEAGERLRPRLSNPDIVFAGSNVAVLESVAAGTATWGVSPIENGEGGQVVEVMRWWRSQPDQRDVIAAGQPVQHQSICVVGTITLPVVHHLWARCHINEPGQLFGVASHPQALIQCARHLAPLGLDSPDKQHSVSSTALAAELIATDERFANWGALASSLAGQLQREKLTLLAADQQDAPENATRFYLVAREPAAPSGNDLTALICWLRNEPAALFQAIAPLASAKLNMTSLHILPLGKVGELGFYLEFAGHQSDPAVRAVLTLIAKVSTRLVFLGSFPAAL